MRTERRTDARQPAALPAVDETPAAALLAELPAVGYALRDPRTPWYARMSAALTVAYALSPIDLVPDFIPVLGWLDDVVLLPALIALTWHLVPAAVRAEAKERASALRPRRWQDALPVIGLWLLLAALLLWLILR